MSAGEPRFLLTVTANYSDDTEANDIEVSGAVPEDEIGEAAMDAAALHTPAGATVTSLVIVAVVTA